MTIGNSISDNILEFKRPENKKIIKKQVVDVIQEQINSALKLNLEPLKKADIVAAIVILNGWNTLSQDVDDIMEDNYILLYKDLLNMICDYTKEYYTEEWFELEFNQDTFELVFIDTKYSSPAITLSIKLVNKEDYSDTHIQISHETNLMCLINSQWWEKSNYLPIMNNKNRNLDTNLPQKERELIQEYTFDKNDIIAAISSNFSENFQTESDLEEELGLYTKNDLITMVVEIIVWTYGDKYNLIINPFSPLLMQCNAGNKLKDLTLNLIINKKNYETSIEVIKEKWNRLFIV